MSSYQNLIVTSHPLSWATTCKAPIIPGSSDYIVGNSRKHLLSSVIKDDQPMTLRRRKQSSTPKLDGLNSESDDNQPAILHRRKLPISSKSDYNKPYIVCLDLLSFLIKQAASLQLPTYDILQLPISVVSDLSDLSVTYVLYLSVFHVLQLPVSYISHLPVFNTSPP